MLKRNKKTAVVKDREKVYEYVFNEEGTMERDRLYKLGMRRQNEKYKKTEEGHIPNTYEYDFSRRSFREFDKYVKNLKHGKILDIGAGTGLAMEQFQDIYPSLEVVGADLKAKPNKKVRMVKADVEHLPFKDNTFEGIVSCETLPYVPDKLKAVVEIYRVLKQGGKAIVTVNNIYNYLADKELYPTPSKNKYIVEKIRNPIKKRKFKKNQLEKILGQESDIEIDGNTIIITKNHEKLNFEGKYKLQDVISVKCDDIEQNYPIYKKKLKIGEKIRSSAKKVKEKLKNLLCIF